MGYITSHAPRGPSLRQAHFIRTRPVAAADATVIADITFAFTFFAVPIKSAIKVNNLTASAAKPIRGSKDDLHCASVS